RLRATLQKPNLFGTRNDVAQSVRDIDFTGVRQSGHAAERRGIENCARDGFVGVPYGDASERHRAVDKDVATSRRDVAARRTGVVRGSKRGPFAVECRWSLAAG